MAARSPVSGPRWWQPGAGAIRRRMGGSKGTVAGGGGAGLAVSRREGRDGERACVPTACWACVGQVWVRGHGWVRVTEDWVTATPLGQPGRLWKNMQDCKGSDS